MNAEDIKATAIKKGLRVTKLMCVSSDNNNKYYDLYQIDDSSFMVIRGRVDVTSIVEGPYNMSTWDRVVKDKTKESKKPKPYTDVTHLFAESKASTATNGKDKGTGGEVGFAKGRPADVVEFVKLLQAFANKSVKENYTVSAKNVTKKQIDEAQSILNQITGMLKKGADTKPINDKLLELYQVIPRKMSKVQNFLLQGDTIKTDKDLTEANNLVSNEQATLDVMAGQVALEAAGDDSTDEKIESDILKSMGLELEPVDAKEEAMIKKMLGANASQYHKAYKATNNATEAKFQEFMKKTKNKKTALLWHGSRNENWWYILQQGLRIRPTSAVLTGAMFGYGIYFADKAQKSIGYTSYSGARWTGGTSSKAILAVYEIHQGEQLEISRWNSDHSRLDADKMKKLGKDTVFAKGGYDLVNNEYIVYHEGQCTIRYIVQIK